MTLTFGDRLRIRQDHIAASKVFCELTTVLSSLSCQSGVATTTKATTITPSFTTLLALLFLLSSPPPPPLSLPDPYLLFIFWLFLSQYHVRRHGTKL